MWNNVSQMPLSKLIDLMKEAAKELQKWEELKLWNDDGGSSLAVEISEKIDEYDALNSSRDIE